MMKHINHVLVARGHPRRHVMHKFWARKPHNVVAEYIERYSKPKGIVLDPFCGSGVTAIEALRLNRKVVAIDLDPVSTFITKMIAQPVDLEELKEAFEQIRLRVKKQINSLYETTCPRCKVKSSQVVTIRRRQRNEPTEIRFCRCPGCKKYVVKKPSKKDIRKIEEVENRKNKNWYPKYRFPNGVTFNQAIREAGDYIYDLFTKRNLLSLSMLFNEIEKLPEGRIKDLMKFTFTSMVHLASKMMPVRPTRPCSSMWALPSYWIPPDEYMESNVWNLFESAFEGRQGVLGGKQDSNKNIVDYVEAGNFYDLEKHANILVSTQSALDLENIPDDSIDYVFTDPPYGGDIQYYELNALWATWLRGKNDRSSFDLNWHNEEITINPERGQDFEYYHNRLHVAFKEIFRVLKPKRYLTVTFHNTSMKVYNSILRAVMFAGFDLERIIYQPPARASTSALLRPYGSAVGDYYIRFRKPKVSKEVIEEREVDEERVRKIIIDVVRKIILERGEPTTFTDILKGQTMIYQELKKYGYRFFGVNPKNIERIIKNYGGDEFIFIKGKGWWFKDPSKHHLQTPLHDRIEEAIIQVLKRKIASFDDILQELFLNFTNALTPNPPSVKAILKEYGTPAKGGKWRLSPVVRVREGEHDKIVEMLAEIGLKVGYNVYADLSGWRVKSHKLPVLREVLPVIKQIDAIWFTSERITHGFEVEHTTAITEAIRRGANIPYKANLYIVIPEERVSSLFSKINEPYIKEGIERFNWNFIYYDDLKRFCETNRRKKSIDLDEFRKITQKTPVLKNKTQKSLGDFKS